MINCFTKNFVDVEIKYTRYMYTDMENERFAKNTIEIRSNYKP